MNTPIVYLYFLLCNVSTRRSLSDLTQLSKKTKCVYLHTWAHIKKVSQRKCADLGSAPTSPYNRIH